MIFYIKNNSQGVLSVSDDSIKQEKGSNLGYIKKICKNNLFSYDGYTSSVKKVLNIFNLIPIVINDYLALFPIRRVRDYENIWINYEAINDYYSTEGGIKIIFDDDNHIVIDLSISKLNHLFSNILRIKKHKTVSKDKL